MVKPFFSEFPTAYNTNYFEPVSDGWYPTGNVYVDTFGIVPGICSMRDINMDSKMVDKLFRAEGYEQIWMREDMDCNNYYVSSKVYSKGDTLAEVMFSREYEETEVSFEDCNIKFFYKEFATLASLAKKINKKIHKREKQGYISLISKTSHGLTTNKFQVKISEFDIALHYGEKFKSTYDTILKRLNTKFDKGIALFHGEPGCGKTSLVKLLTKHIKGKEVIFVPPYMVETIGSPEFVPFLMDHPNSILVVEDAERVLLSRDSGEGSSQGVSSLLNLSDGILGDCLNIQIIATFNTKRDNIDKALLRKGRLIAEYEFGKLSAEDSNKLLKHLGKEATAEKAMSLADIYGIDKEEIKSTPEERPAIGFSANRY